MDDRVLETLMPQRIASDLLALLGFLAVAIAAVGLYGLIAHAVAQRRREFGVRMALGASPAAIAGGVLRDGLRLAAVGIGLGLVAGFAVARLLAGQLPGVSSTDPLTYAGIAALVAAIALLATWLPARRASRIDPMTALKAGLGARMGALAQDLKYASGRSRRAPASRSRRRDARARHRRQHRDLQRASRACSSRPLPYPEAGPPGRARSQPLGVPELSDLRAATRSFDAMGGASPMAFDLTASASRSSSGRARGRRALRGARRARRARPPAGRGDDVPGGERSSRCRTASGRASWPRDHAIVGRAITLGGVPYTVAGVLAPEFQLPDIPADVFTPLQVAYPMAAQARGAHMLRAVFRLRRASRRRPRAAISTPR